jgi:hypothetical protein
MSIVKNRLVYDKNTGENKMQEYNTINYFFIPFNEITDEMVSHMNGGNVETVR